MVFFKNGSPVNYFQPKPGKTKEEENKHALPGTSVTISSPVGKPTPSADSLNV